MILSIGFYFFLAVAFVLGLFLGAGVAYTLFESRGKLQIRKSMGEKPGRPKVAPKVETRKDKRLDTSSIVVMVLSPKLDTAGVALPDEDERLEAELVDISKNGAAILTKHFFKKGLKIKIFSEVDEPRFKRGAEVRNISVFSRGLRIGVQFDMPLTLSSMQEKK